MIKADFAACACFVGETGVAMADGSMEEIQWFSPE
jgi:hypothetical protein